MLRFLFAHRLSIVLTFLGLGLTLLPVPETPLSRVRFIDKYTHFIMYGGYALALWSEVRGPMWRNYLLCLCWPIVLGGLLEIAQSLLRTGRQGDLYDFMANAFGAVLVLPLGLYVHRRLSH